MYKIVHIEETDSTNRWMRQQEGQEAQVVVADYQTAGRGCGTNSWESERGQNLLFSILLHPIGVAAADQFIISMANALALRDALDEYIDDVRIKWPNDIYWRDKKICGTLIETTLQGSNIRTCIIGTGINVNQRRFTSDAPNPVSLYQILGHEVEQKELLLKVLLHLEKYMEMVGRGAWSVIRQAYHHHLYRLGETHAYRFQDGSYKQCKLLGVTDDGHLKLLAGGKDVYEMTFKEVSYS